jgi:hypothetical protein
MLVAIALLALVLPSRMIAAAPARMILGNGGRSKSDNGENGKDATEIDHICFPKIGGQCGAHQVRWYIRNLQMLTLSASYS